MFEENSVLPTFTVGKINSTAYNSVDSPLWKNNDQVIYKTDLSQKTIGIGVDAFKVEKKHNHYFKDVSKLNEIDVYRVIDLFKVTDPCLQHALKKLLVTGGRDGQKSKEQDVLDVIASCNRWLEMQRENNK